MFMTIDFEWRGLRFGHNVGEFVHLVPDLDALRVSQLRPSPKKRRNKQDAITAKQWSNNRRDNSESRRTYSIGAESDAQALSLTSLYLRQDLVVQSDE